jgi:Flp pilus assembly protein TadB
LDWLLLAALGIMWAAFLIPLTSRRRRSTSASVGDFERRMEFLAHAEVNGTTGRWIVTPRKGARFVGDAERRRARIRDRRRRILVFLIEAIGISFLIGLVPPLRVVWNVTLALAILLGAYVWMLISMKHRSQADPRETVRNARVPRDHAAAFAARYVIEGQNGRAREMFNGLEGLAESDRVHVVVRPASAG